LSNYTEAAFGGYAAVSQSWSNYTLNGVAAHQGYAIAAPINFTNSSGGPQNVYGYYVTDSTSTILLAAAEFDAPPVTIPSGTPFTMVPNWGDLSQLSS
jgi:hypothetical protein